jgi:hypothetical protein
LNLLELTIHPTKTQIFRRPLALTLRPASRPAVVGNHGSEPRVYREYAPDYYAIYFTDPDGIRLEIVGRTHTRDLIRDRWHELAAFENPLEKLHGQPQ